MKLALDRQTRLKTILRRCYLAGTNNKHYSPTRPRNVNRTSDIVVECIADFCDTYINQQSTELHRDII